MVLIMIMRLFINRLKVFNTRFLYLIKAVKAIIILNNKLNIEIKNFTKNTARNITKINIILD